MPLKTITESEDLRRIASFCPTCNYAESKININRAKFDARLRDWKDGEHHVMSIPPPAMPNPDIGEIAAANINATRVEEK